MEHDKNSHNFSGTLYIVATPIGNLQDITFRAIETLKMVDLIVCEDTRVSSRLLTHYDIKKPLLSLNEFNEEQMIYTILKHLQTQNVALISDAGTPLISDPGFRLVAAAHKNGHTTTPIPGPSAVITALSAATLPTDKFSFLGFLSKSQSKNAALLASYKELKTTIVLFESPHRVEKTLQTILTVFGDCEVTIARELTKIHEEITIRKISDWKQHFSTTTPKGEFVLLFSTK